jgi:hypothetical protein
LTHLSRQPNRGRPVERGPRPAGFRGGRW